MKMEHIWNQTNLSLNPRTNIWLEELLHYMKLIFVICDNFYYLQGVYEEHEALCTFPRLVIVIMILSKSL